MGKIIALLLVLVALSATCVIAVPPARAADASANSWATMAPMPTSVAGDSEAVSLNGKLYVIGGVIPTQFGLTGRGTASISEYDPATDTWTTKKPYPTPRDMVAVAACQNKIYVMGGMMGNNGAVCSINEAYDPLTDSWETKAPMPTGRMEMDANVVNGKIYVIGGRNLGVYSTVALNEVYDPVANTWTTEPPIPYPVAQYASAAVDDNIYIIGGTDEFNPQIYLRNTEIYDTKTSNWSQGASMPIGTWQASAAATSGTMAPKRIYVMGGADAHGHTSTDVYVYDPKANVWSAGASMSWSLIYATVAEVNDLLYAIGTAVTNPASVGRYTPLEYGTVPPAVSIVCPANNQTYLPDSVPLSFTVNRPTAQVTRMSYSFDGYEAIAVTGNATLTGLSSGSHSVTVYATDTFGNTGTSETITFSVAPQVSVLSPQYQTYNSSSVPLNFRVNEPILQAAYSLDGQDNVTVTGNTTLTGLLAGSHNVTVYAIDNLGNTGTSETITFTIAKPEPFPTTLVAVSVAVVVAVVSFGLVAYSLRRNRERSET